MKLEELPIDLLGLIFDGEHSWAVIELWKTGNRALRYRFVNGGIKVVKLEDSHGATTSRWPRCLKEFKLTSLSVHRAHEPLASPQTLLNEVKQLHRGLKSFELRAQDAVKSLFGDFCSSTDSLWAGWNESEPPSSKRSKTQEVDSDALHTERWNLGTTWPQLERLAVSEDPDAIAHFDGIKIHPTLLHLVPTTLNYLELAYWFIGEPLDDVSFLPNLHTLRINCQFSTSGFKTLPRTITDLGSYIDVELGAVCLKEPELFPFLKFPGNEHADNVDYEFLASHDLKLPSSIQYAHLPLDWPLTKLPSSLTYISLWSKILQSDSIAILPRTLVTLKVTSIQWDGLSASCWPSTLAQLKLSSAAQFGAHCFHLLPRSLKYFSIGEFEELYSLDRSQQEHRGTQDERWFQQSIDLDTLKSHGMASLKLEMDAWLLERSKLVNGGAECQDYISAIESGGLLGLPLGLTDLFLHIMPFHIKTRTIFPPNLRMFHYKSESVCIDDPAILSGFSPKGSLFFRAAVNDSTVKPNDVIPTQLALCRSHITKIEILLVTPKLARSLLKCLPRTLLELSFSGPAFVYNEELDDLPPKLESLRMGDCSLQDPLAPWTSQLPANLTFLHVQIPILGHDILKLPPKLTIIEAPFFETTLAQVRQLPRSLNSLTVPRCNETSYADRHNMMHKESWETLISTYRPFWRLWETSEAGNAAAIDYSALPLPDVSRCYRASGPNESCYPSYEAYNFNSYSESLAALADDDKDFQPTSQARPALPADLDIDPRTVQRLSPYN